MERPSPSPLLLFLLALALVPPLPSPAQSTGSYDPTFRIAPGGTPTPAGSYAPVAEGRVLVAGQFTAYHGIPRPGVARLLADGSVDPDFDPGTGPGELVTVIPGGPTLRNPGYATHVAALTDGRALVAGSFSSWNGFATRSLARLGPNGSVDTTFASTLPTGGPLFPLPDGKVLVAGRAGDFGSNRKIGLVRIHPEGALDTSFGDAGVGAHTGLDFDAATVQQVARQSDGKLLVLFGGLAAGQPGYGVARLNADGTLDAGFKSGLTRGITSVLTGIGVDDLGRVLVCGTATTFGGQSVAKVFRLTSTGALDPTYVFQPPTSSASGIHVFGDGSALVTGMFTGIFGPVVRVQADGARDTAFGLTQTGSFGTVFVAVAGQPKVNAAGQTFLLSSAFLLQSGAQIVQGNGPVRLTGGGGGGTVTPPTITTPPASATAAVGAAASFTVAATGTAPLNYQWRKDGSPIAGATATTHSIPQVAESDAGEYAVVVSNLGGSVTSQVATLTVTRPPRFTSLPASPILVAQGVPASLVAVADGPGTLRFQWYRNGAALAGATNATLHLVDPQAGDVGSYEIEVASEYGTARSPALQVVLAPSAPTWFVASNTDGPGQITDLWRDGPRGVVVAGNYGAAGVGAPEFTFGGVAFPRPTLLNGFVGRIDDAGTPLWMTPIVGDLSHGLRVATYVATAADAAGNVFVAGPIRGVGTLAGLNLGAAGTEGTFVAKLDSGGQGRWAHLVTGNLYERQLAVDGNGNLILTGRYTSALATQNRTLPAVEFGAAAVFKFGADGALAWANHYQKADTVGGAVDIYNVTADASGIYLAGTYDQSIRFGTFTERLLAPPFRAVGWLGKLDATGAATWLKAIGGSLPTDLALGPQGSLWIVGQDDPPGGQVLHGYRTDGTFVARGVVARSGSTGGSLLARGVAVDSARRPLLGGQASGIASVGALALGVGQNPVGMWGAAGTPAGVVTTDARLTGYLTVPPAGELWVNEFEASPASEFYYAGAWTGVLNVNGKPTNSAARKIFVTKTAGIPLPAPPVIIHHPASQLFALGQNRTLSCTATGGGLGFRWLKNGQPIPENNLRVDTYAGARPGETSSVITFLGLTEANAGDYTCEATNALGAATSNAARFESGSLPEIVSPPLPQRIDAGQPFTLTVVATGGSLTYEWYRNGAPIPGAPNQPTFTIPAASPDDATLYSVVVYNGLGTVSSDAVRVIVCSGEPESTFLGRPWVKVLDDTMSVPGTPTAFGAFAREDRPRFTLKDRTVHLVATAGARNALAPGHRALLRWRAGTLETLVWTNRLTADGDRFVDCFYPTDETEGAMNFTAFTLDAAGLPRAALYELRQGTLSRRADDRTPLPTGSGRFLTWGSNVRRGSTMIGYPGTFGDLSGAGSGIYAVGTDSLRQLVAGNAVLPSPTVTRLGGLPSNFGLSFDGTHAVFAVADVATPTRQAVFLADLAGNVTRLAQVGDPLPGRAGETFADFGAADLAGGATYFVATGTSRETWLVRSAAGQLQTLGTAHTLAAAGPDQVYADGGTGLVSRYAGGDPTPETVLPTNARIDCRRVTRVWQVDAEGDDVAVGVDLADGGVAVFVNLGSGPITPPATLRLPAPTLDGNRLRFAVPTEAGKTYRIESTAGLGTEPWGVTFTLTGDGTAKPVEVPVTDSRRFYRVVEP